MKGYVQKGNKIIETHYFKKDSMEDFIESMKERKDYLFHHIEDEWVEVFVEGKRVDYKEMWLCLEGKVLEDLINLKTGQSSDKDLKTLEYIKNTMKEFEAVYEK